AYMRQNKSPAIGRVIVLMKYKPMIEKFRQAIIENGIPPTSESRFLWRGSPPVDADRLAARPSMNLFSTRCFPV
ncbi:MAG: hypothetical protein WBE42_03900, partial [Pseudolabrys sp.]